MEITENRKAMIKRILISILIFLLLLPLIQTGYILAFNNNRIIYKDGIFTLITDKGTFYNVNSIKQINNEISDADISRLNNLSCINTNECTYEFVYYEDAVYFPIFNNFNKDKMHKGIFFGNEVYIDIGSYVTPKTKNYYKESVELPLLSDENISKILIESNINEENILFENEKITEFLNNSKKTLDEYDINFKDYTIKVWYYNSDDDLFETFDKSNFLKTQNSQLYH